MIESSTARVATLIEKHALDAEILSTTNGVSTVELAANALNVQAGQIIKTLVFVSPDNQLVIAIACGTGRIDRGKLAAAAGVGTLKFAPAPLVFETTGYPAGGVAPIGLPSHAIVIIDELVVAHTEVYGGGGSDLHMLRIHTEDIVRLNNAMIARISQSSTD